MGCTADLGLLRSRERVRSESLHRVVSNERVLIRRVVDGPLAEAAVDHSGTLFSAAAGDDERVTPDPHLF